MRVISFFLACFFTVQPLHAEVVQVPLLADGTVDLDEVHSSFSISFPIYGVETQYSEFVGEILGEPFAGTVFEADLTQDISLSIEAPTLSEHGNFLIAVSVTGIFCLQKGLRSGTVLWQETGNHTGAIWEVSSSCIVATELGSGS